DALPALPDGDVAQGPVVEVDHAGPGDVVGVDVEFVTLEQMIVENGRTEVVGRRDRVDVAGEMEVDVLHGDDLSVAASGGATLDTETRPQRRLAQRTDGLLADLVEPHAEPNVRGGLAFTGRSGCDGGAEHQLAVGLVLE